MELNSNGSNKLTTSEVSGLLGDLGYRWSNEAQCYYSTNFELPLLTHEQGRSLAKAIMENI